MQTKENKLFTQEALDRLSSTDQLDQMMQVVNPRAWLPLSTIGFLLIVAGVWSIVGRIPLNVTGQGVFIRPRHVVQFQAPSAGQLLNLKIEPGDVIKKGEEIGIIDQSNLKQQLEQEKTKLAQLQGQNKNTDRLQKQQIELQLKTLKQQQADLEESLRRESVTPMLHQQTLAALEQKRQSLEESLEREKIAPVLHQQTLTALEQKRLNLVRQKEDFSSILETLKQRYENRLYLFEVENAISQDVLLQAKRELLDTQTQVSNIETQLKELDVQKTNTDREYLQNLNKVNEIKNNIQQIKVEKTNAEREYLQTLNQIDEIQTKQQEIEAEKAKLVQQNLEKEIDKTNEIEEIKRQIAQLELQLKKDSKVISQYDGRVLELSAVSGQFVNVGNSLGSIEAENPDKKMLSVVYFSDKDGKQIKPGMTVQVTPSVVKRERYGGIIGQVTQVSPFPVTKQEMSVLIGNENLANNLAQSVSNNAALIQVFVKLEEDKSNISEYELSSSNGPALQISTGTTAQVRVQIGQVAPISYVMPIFRSLTGIY
ncbi:NHLP bacteriocin system secretion protein [Limnoraphis robusta]|uniref:Secretion protein HlyD n=1 Tax=Limnoraphis robusta CS-951 TaxID=1637645 RepID=A0A0F5YHC4_9CYAN|nr:NHLP bacteriocin system secretion protein [Limnoraphis robusta]KKD38037.1 secretion protein HlyD [Limnoraphis robusta CS-951]